MTDWASVIDPLFDLLEGDAALTAVIPVANMVMNGEREFDHDDANSLEYTIISSTTREVLAPVILQTDIQCRSMADLVTAETRVRDLWVREIEQTIAGIYMLISFELGHMLQGARDGLLRRSLRFRIQPIRMEYTT